MEEKLRKFIDQINKSWQILLKNSYKIMENWQIKETDLQYIYLMNYYEVY